MALEWEGVLGGIKSVEVHMTGGQKGYAVHTIFLKSFDIYKAAYLLT
jgi:hypothetical protein